MQTIGSTIIRERVCKLCATLETREGLLWVKKRHKLLRLLAAKSTTERIARSCQVKTSRGLSRGPPFVPLSGAKQALDEKIVFTARTAKLVRLVRDLARVVRRYRRGPAKKACSRCPQRSMKRSKWYRPDRPHLSHSMWSISSMPMVPLRSMVRGSCPRAAHAPFAR